VVGLETFTNGASKASYIMPVEYFSLLVEQQFPCYLTDMARPQERSEALCPGMSLNTTGTRIPFNTYSWSPASAQIGIHPILPASDQNLTLLGKVEVVPGGIYRLAKVPQHELAVGIRGGISLVLGYRVAVLLEHVPGGTAVA
jgi:hypothetical protein